MAVQRAWQAPARTVGVTMRVSSWALVATVLGVIVYVALPVALAVIYLSRVRAWLGRKRPQDRSTERLGGGDGD